MDLTTAVETRPGWTVLRVYGDVDLTTAPRFRERVLQLIADGHHHVVVDLEGVDLLDSTGLGILIGALRRVRLAGGDLRLVSVDPTLSATFEITGLGAALPLAASVEEAIRTKRR